MTAATSAALANAALSQRGIGSVTPISSALVAGDAPRSVQQTAFRYEASQLHLTEPARALWHQAYRQLARPQPGIAGQLNARAEAHTIRLALIYALLDRAADIRPEHLQAALALQDYTARSAAWALEPDTGDPIAEQLHSALQRSPDGLTRTQLRDLLHRNVSARRLDQALANLAADGKADHQRILTAGRPAELWTAKR